MSFNPDIIFSQFNGLVELSKFVIKKSCKIVYFLHSCFDYKGHLIDIEILKSQVVSHIVCLSNFIRNSLPDELQSKATVVYPIFFRDKYLTYKNNNNFTKILFFNPIKLKGIDIIIELAKTFKDEEFIIYETWNLTSDEYRRKLADIKNISLKKTENIAYELYNNIKIYLLPSQCEEGFGRGVVEANINSIPIIASKNGGIVEAAGENQLLVKDYTNVEEWKKSLALMLHDVETYSLYQEKALNNSKRFETTELLKIIQN